MPPCSLTAAPNLLPHRGSLASLTRSDPTFLASAAGADSLCTRVAFWLTLVSPIYGERPEGGTSDVPTIQSGTGLRPRPEGPASGASLRRSVSLLFPPWRSSSRNEVGAQEGHHSLTVSVKSYFIFKIVGKICTSLRNTSMFTLM